MLFLSELIGKNVTFDEKRYVGKLRDIMFLNEDTPRITKIIVQSDAHRIHEIPLTAIRRVKGHILAVKSTESQNSQNELSASRALLDPQIIDLVGNKVVRVNDVVIHHTTQLTISGIDIAILGIFRRIGMES